MLTRFSKGFFAPLSALRLILTSPSLLSLVLVPLLINIGLYALFFWWGSDFLQSIVATWVERFAQTLPPWLVSISQWALKLLAWILLASVAAFSFTIVGGIIAAPFNDFLSKRTTRILSQKRGEAVLANELAANWRQVIGLELKRTLILVAGGIFAFVLALIPFMQLPALMIGALLLSFEYFGYPISQTSPKLGPVWSFTLRNWILSLGLGCFLLLLMALPLVSMLYIPLAVVAATRLHSELQYEKSRK